jgi:hypothetical protein
VRLVKAVEGVVGVTWSASEVFEVVETRCRVQLMGKKGRGEKGVEGEWRYEEQTDG